jgi:hypothetical protein
MHPVELVALWCVAGIPGRFVVREHWRMDAQPDEKWWVVSFLVTGDEDGVMAVAAEGLMQSALWESADGSQPVASTVGRFGDLPPHEQEDWRRVMQRQAID